MNKSASTGKSFSRRQILFSVLTGMLTLVLVAVFLYFCPPFWVSFRHNEKNYIKLYQSEHSSPGGNEKTDELKTLFATVKERTPSLTPYPEKDPYPGDERIHAVFFDGEECMGKPARVFAYIGFPEGASAENPVPGMVLVHGGGCHAWASWVKYWVDHGYAAISMDGFGQIYTGPDHSYSDDSALWSIDPLSHLPMDGFESKDKPFTEQWFYYFISDIILSNNILRADARVKADKIGLTGISWGGFASSVAICYDERFAFAAPVYGSGFQDVSTTLWGQGFRGEGISDVWDARNLLSEVQMPVIWFNSNGDAFFSAEASTACAAVAPNGAVDFIPNFTHGMVEGIALPEILRFANEQNGIGEGNIKIDAISFDGDKVVVSFTLPEDARNITSAYIYYRSTPLDYDGHDLTIDWKTRKGYVRGNNACLSIPAGTTMFYVMIKTKTNGFFSSKAIHATSGVYKCD